MPSRSVTYHDLRDKIVLVTGGAQGIGAATVEHFALQGSRVLFLDIDDAAAQKTIDRITALSQDAERSNEPAVHIPVFHHCDMTDLTAIQTTITEILAKWGVVNVLINNAAGAGSQARVPTGQVTAEDWDFGVNANLRHVFFLTQAVIPAMKKSGSGGSIVNLGSITWRIPAAGLPVYSMSKAAIMGLTRVQSKEVGDANIRINSVMPGAIATQRQRDEILTPEYRAEVMRNQSLQRDLEPSEVANVIVFLASDQASGVTGSSYTVDGGWCSDP